MLKLINILGATLSAEQVIPLETKLNTNNKLSFNSENNTISINKAGYYHINASVTFTSATAGTYALDVLANDILIPEAQVSITIAANDTATLVVDDIEKISPMFSDDKVKLTFSMSKAVTLLNANVSVYEIK